jgi:hypothetical protein
MGTVSESAAVLLPSDASTKVRFVPTADFNGTVALYYRAWDRTQGQPGKTFNIGGNTGGSSAFSVSRESAALVITPVNDKPVLKVGSSIAYSHDKPTITLAATATVTDVDSANFAGGELRVRLAVAGSSNRLAIGSGFTVDANNNVKLGTTTIGKLTANGFGTKDLIVTFNTAATKAIVQQLVRAITFKTVGGAAGPHQVLFSVSDGDGGLSAEVTKLVNVT